MILCDLQPLPSGRWFCKRCDPERQRTTPKKSHRECRVRLPAKEEARINTLAAIEYGKNCMAWHFYPLRTPEQIKPLLAVCLSCDRYPCEEKPCTWKKRLACVGFRECERWGE